MATSLRGGFPRSALLALSVTLPASLRAQGMERTVFLVRQGSDTLAVETTTRDARRAEGSLWLRTPRVRIGQGLALGDSGLVTRLSSALGLGVGGDSAVRRADLTFFGDSAVARVEGAPGAPPGPDVRMKAAAGAIPFTNLSGLSLEQILRRARAIGGDTARVPVLLMTGGRVLVAEVARAGADSATITIAGTVFRARTDGEGRLLGGAVPAQGLVFERLPAGSRAAAWRPPAAAAPPSYAAPPGAPYTAEEVVVRTPAGIKLAGTLTVPARRARQRVPAVLLISGTGPQDRDEATPAIEGWRPFREVADTLSRRGVAVLRLDDRGVGGSDAGPPTATAADHADDVRAAVAWLRARADVDGDRVGLVGHSEGGIIAPMVAASDPRVRALVLVAAPASAGREIVRMQNAYFIGRDSTRTAAARDSLLREASRQVDSVAAAPGPYRFFIGYDPLPTARRVRQPVLVLQGETDRQVPARQARLLADAMRSAGNARVTLRTFPRLNHLLLDDPSGNPLAYHALPSFRVRRDLLGALAEWLARTL